MIIALLIAYWNGLEIPALAWVLFGLEVLERLLDWWLKD